MKRKDFLKTGAVLTGGILFPINKLFPFNIKNEPEGFKLLRDSVGIYSNRGGTIGWFVNNDAAVVIDTQFPDTAKIFLEGLSTKHNDKIDVLFNTHHHVDHTAGNRLFKENTLKIVAQENVPVYQQRSHEGKESEKEQVYADTTFNDEYEIIIGNEKITAKYFGVAHTSGDSVIHFENANIAHLGDLVFNGVYPFIDMNSGNLTEWSTVLNKIINYYDNDTLFIFGHGVEVTGNKKDIERKISYLNSLLEYVEKEKREGKSLEEIQKIESLKGFENIKSTREDAFKRNLEAAYKSIKLYQKNFVVLPFN